MSEKPPTSFCQGCPIPGRRAGWFRPVADCPGPTVVERVGVVTSLEGRGEPMEVGLSLSPRLCGRRDKARIEEIIGPQTTENRILDIEQVSGVLTITVASAPAALMTRLYGSAPAGTPAAMPEPVPVAAGERPQLEVVTTMDTVYGQLSRVIELVEGIGLLGLIGAGAARVARLEHEVDGTGNDHALAMQAAAYAVMNGLQVAFDAADGLMHQVELYKNSTSG